MDEKEIPPVTDSLLSSTEEVRSEYCAKIVTDVTDKINENIKLTADSTDTNVSTETEVTATPSESVPETALLATLPELDLVSVAPEVSEILTVPVPESIKASESVAVPSESGVSEPVPEATTEPDKAPISVSETVNVPETTTVDETVTAEIVTVPAEENTSESLTVSATINNLESATNISQPQETMSTDKIAPKPIQTAAAPSISGPPMIGQKKIVILQNGKAQQIRLTSQPTNVGQLTGTKTVNTTTLSGNIQLIKNNFIQLKASPTSTVAGGNLTVSTAQQPLSAVTSAGASPKCVVLQRTATRPRLVIATGNGPNMKVSVSKPSVLSAPSTAPVAKREVTVAQAAQMALASNNNIKSPVSESNANRHSMIMSVVQQSQNESSAKPVAIKEVQTVPGKQIQSVPGKQLQTISGKLLQTVPCRILPTVSGKQLHAVQPSKQLHGVTLKQVHSGPAKQMQIVSVQQPQTAPNKQPQQMQAVSTKVFTQGQSIQTKQLQARQFHTVPTKQHQTIPVKQLQALPNRQLHTVASKQLQTVPSKQLQFVASRQSMPATVARIPGTVAVASTQASIRTGVPAARTSLPAAPSNANCTVPAGMVRHQLTIQAKDGTTKKVLLPPNLYQMAKNGLIKGLKVTNGAPFKAAVRAIPAATGTTNVSTATRLVGSQNIGTHPKEMEIIEAKTTLTRPNAVAAVNAANRPDNTAAVIRPMPAIKVDPASTAEIRRHLASMPKVQGIATKRKSADTPDQDPDTKATLLNRTLKMDETIDPFKLQRQSGSKNDVTYSFETPRVQNRSPPGNNVTCSVTATMIDTNVKSSQSSISVSSKTAGTASESEPEGPRRKHCNCTKSQCLKLYCDCFANGEFCKDCNCKECFNNIEFEQDRQNAIKMCLERNPHAFKPKIGKSKDTADSSLRQHNKGCNCKRSGCLKNYCECYEAKIACSGNCKCVDCHNTDHFSDDRITGNSLRSSLDRVSGTTRTSLPTSRFLLPVSGVTVANTSLPEFDMDLAEQATRSGSASPEIPPKKPCNFMTPDVIEATIQCVIAQADECQKNSLDKKTSEKLILEEFGRCLVEIIDFSLKNPEN